MPEQTNGIEAMRERMARASRKPPPSRRPASAPVSDESRTSPPAPEPAPARRRQKTASHGATRLAADLPPVNLAIRVRKPLDDHLVDLIHALRGMGVKTSKVELIEMLLWELPQGDDAPEAIIERLRGFRTWAPRGTGTLPD